MLAFRCYVFNAAYFFIFHYITILILFSICDGKNAWKLLFCCCVSGAERREWMNCRKNLIWNVISICLHEIGIVCRSKWRLMKKPNVSSNTALLTIACFFLIYCSLFVYKLGGFGWNCDMQRKQVGSPTNSKVERKTTATVIHPVILQSLVLCCSRLCWLPLLLFFAHRILKYIVCVQFQRRSCLNI